MYTVVQRVKHISDLNQINAILIVELLKVAIVGHVHLPLSDTNQPTNQPGSNQPTDRLTD
jgi:hypothetical protein